MDLIGQRFGRLTVIDESPRSGYVVCKCDCGNVKTVQKGSLLRKNNAARSCGCYRKEVSSERGRANIKQNSAARIELNKKYGTNVGLLMNNRPRANNTSGHIGVCFDAVHKKYYARICLHNKRYFLGYFDNLQDAINAREKAEEKMFLPIIEARTAEIHQENLHSPSSS